MSPEVFYVRTRVQLLVVSANLAYLEQALKRWIGRWDVLESFD